STRLPWQGRGEHDGSGGVSWPSATRAAMPWSGMLLYLRTLPLHVLPPVPLVQGLLSHEVVLLEVVDLADQLELLQLLVTHDQRVLLTPEAIPQQADMAGEDPRVAGH